MKLNNLAKTALVAVAASFAIACSSAKEYCGTPKNAHEKQKKAALKQTKCWKP